MNTHCTTGLTRHGAHAQSTPLMLSVTWPSPHRVSGTESSAEAIFLLAKPPKRRHAAMQTSDRDTQWPRAAGRKGEVSKQRAKTRGSGRAPSASAAVFPPLCNFSGPMRSAIVSTVVVSCQLSVGWHGSWEGAHSCGLSTEQRWDRDARDQTTRSRPTARLASYDCTVRATHTKLDSQNAHWLQECALRIWSIDLVHTALRVARQALHTPLD
jgi:hypothetical protein